MKYDIAAEIPGKCAKARVRTALRLLGAESVRIVASEAGAAPRPLRPDTLPTRPESIALAALFGRPPEQEWSDVEIQEYRKAHKKGLVTMENLQLLAKYYRAERKKGDDGIHRRDLLRCVRHFSTELDRARAYANRNKTLSTGFGWHAPQSKIVPMPEPEPVEPPSEAEIAAEKERIAKLT